MVGLISLIDQILGVVSWLVSASTEESAEESAMIKFWEA